MILRFLLLFILCIGIPLLTLPIGLRFVKISEEPKIKKFAYNSKKSITNLQTWQFANYKLGRVWIYGGLLVFLLNLVLYLSFSKRLLEEAVINYFYATISLLFTLSLILISLIYIEIVLIRKLKK